MKINKILILAGLICLTSLSSCQSVKKGLSGKKKKSGDEFLVKKKNPLVKPKNFDELPKPSQKSNDGTIEANEQDNVEDIFQIDKEETSSKNSDLSELEKKILKSISKD